MRETSQGAEHAGSSASDVAAQALSRWADEPGPLLPILHEIQDTLGYIPGEVVPQIAQGLNLSRAEVHGVVTYYHHFRTERPARHNLQVCRAESCRAVGGEALYRQALQRAGCDEHGAAGHGGRSADGSLQVEPVYCLGLCAASPAVMVDGRLHARMTPARLDALVDGLEDSQ